MVDAVQNAKAVLLPKALPYRTFPESKYPLNSSAAALRSGVGGHLQERDPSDLYRPMSLGNDVFAFCHESP